MAIGFSSSPRDIREQGTQRNVRGKKTRNPGYEPGNHWVQCDRCSASIRAEDAMITWDNLVVCPDDWEIRHPQDFVRGRYDDIVAKEPRRSEGPDLDINGNPVSADEEVAEVCGLPMLSSGIEKNYTDSGIFISDAWCFSSDGNKMFVVNNTNGQIAEYTLNAPYSIDGAAFVGLGIITFSNVQSMVFSNDGTKFYIFRNNGELYQYTPLTPNTVLGFIPNPVFKDATAEWSNPINATFDSTGTRLWVIVNTSTLDGVLEFKLNVPFQLSSLNLTPLYKLNTDPDLGVATPTGFAFSPDGRTMFVTASNLEIYQYKLNNPFNLTRSSLADSQDINDDVEQIRTNPDDEDRLFIQRPGDDVIVQYALSCFESGTQIYQLPITDDGLVVNFQTVSGGENTTAGDIFIGNNNTKLYIVQQPPRIYQYTIVDPNDVTSITYDGRSDQILGISTVQSLTFSDDGSLAFVGDLGDDIVTIELNTPWDVTSGFTIVRQTETGLVSPSSFHFDETGTRFWINGGSGAQTNLIKEYSLSTAYDLTDLDLATPVAEFDYVTGGSLQTARSWYFSDDGKRLYVNPDVGADFNQYNLTTAYDITTAFFLRQEDSALLNPLWSRLINNDSKIWATQLGTANIRQGSLTLTTIS